LKKKKSVKPADPPRVIKPLTRQEQETVVHWSRDKTIPGWCSTHDERQAQKLIRAGARVHKEGERGGVSYWVLEIPNTWCRFPRPRRTRPSTVTVEAPGPTTTEPEVES
jgi:hypothetical protein